MISRNSIEKYKLQNTEGIEMFQNQSARQSRLLIRTECLLSVFPPTLQPIYLTFRIQNSHKGHGKIQN